MMKIMMKMTRVIWVCVASMAKKKTKIMMKMKTKMKMNMVAVKPIWDIRAGVLAAWAANKAIAWVKWEACSRMKMITSTDVKAVEAVWATMKMNTITEVA